MRPRKRSSVSAAVKPGEGSARPDVILDVRFDQGLFYIALINISDVPAYRVSVRFEKKFRGLGGECEMSSLRLFRRVEFLAPHKRIETLLDSSRAYFQRREPTVIKARLTFRDACGKAHAREVVHNLAIYKNVSYVVNREPLILSPAPTTAPCATSPPPEKDSTYGNLKRASLLQFQFSR